MTASHDEQGAGAPGPDRAAPSPSDAAPGAGVGGPAPLSDAERVALAARIDGWFAEELRTNPMYVAVDHGEPGEWRWYVRLAGEEKDYTTIWFTLGQRSLRFEAYVLPAPEENHARFYEHLLRRNRNLRGVAFCIGEEDAVFLVGQLRADHVEPSTLDAVVGTVYAAVEQCFVPALRIGFARYFAR